jgi:hypothetical protein
LTIVSQKRKFDSFVYVQSLLSYGEFPHPAPAASGNVSVAKASSSAVKTHLLMCKPPGSLDRGYSPFRGMRGRFLVVER